VVNLSQLCRQLLVVHHEVRARQIEVLMPGLTVDQIKRIRCQEGLAWQQRRQLCHLIRDEVRLRMAATEAKRPWTQMEVQRYRRGARGR
jgi:hypothetical protein